MNAWVLHCVYKLWQQQLMRANVTLKKIIIRKVYQGVFIVNICIILPHKYHHLQEGNDISMRQDGKLCNGWCPMSTLWHHKLYINSGVYDRIGGWRECQLCLNNKLCNICINISTNTAILNTPQIQSLLCI